MIRECFLKFFIHSFALVALFPVPIFRLSAGRNNFEQRDSWKVFVDILVLMGWAVRPISPSIPSPARTA